MSEEQKDASRVDITASVESQVAELWNLTQRNQERLDSLTKFSWKRELMSWLFTFVFLLALWVSADIAIGWLR